MNEHETTAASAVERSRDERLSDRADFRRLEVALERHAEPIADGIAYALEKHTDIGDEAARHIAHVLGRGLGNEGPLTEYAETGEGYYLSLRDAYLELYKDPRATPVAKELIDWFGTYLIQREGIGTGRRFMNPHMAPKLGQLLVRTQISLGDERFLINVPGTWDSGDEDDVSGQLADLQLPEDEPLQAFLALPDVSAGAEDIMEAFHGCFVGRYDSFKAAINDLAGVPALEADLEALMEKHDLAYGIVEVLLSCVEDHMTERYDFADHKGYTYVFQK